MIIVSAILVPHGDLESDRMEMLCNLKICNDGTGSYSRRNYTVQLFSKGEKPRLIREARISNFPSQKLPAWRLIARAFQVVEKSGSQLDFDFEEGGSDD